MPTLKSDKGYYIIIAGRCGILYFDEQNTEFSLAAEMVNSPLYDFVVSSKDITTSGKVLSDQDKKEIIQRVYELCKDNNIKLLITED